MTPSPLDRPMSVPLLCLAVLVGAAAFGLLANPHFTDRLLAEGGPVETASVALHLLAASVAFVMWRKRGALFGFLALAELLMAMRELDVHRAFTTFGVFSTRLYARPDVPLFEKLGAALAIFAIVALLAGLLWRSRSELRLMAAERSPAFRGLVAVAVFTVALKEIDGLPRMLARVGVILSERADTVSHAIEELGEMALPVLVLAVILQHARATSASVSDILRDPNLGLASR